ncbi:hypothetical protein MRB53_000581 [Persea americana]|uniref:Uncharacterized protein n=1 Tax=Persea americana TaxID=3435 RepID=A0ACC2MPI9_PERAE|nr:hypothetical protein MRB53_000581 [Persea americana]
MVTKFPSLLLSDPNKTLSPKIDVFKRYGVSGPDLTKIISSSPSLFQASVNKQIIPSFDFLRSVVHTDENVSATLRRSSRLFQSNLEKKIAPNISIIRSHGVPDSNIAKLIVTHPRTVLLGVERFGEIVAFVKEMDFNPLSANFTFAIRVMSGMKKSNWERKMKVYERLGWSKEEFLSAFKVQPKCMMVSEEKIVKVAEFLQCEMGWKPSILAKCPNLLLYSLEKRTIPRCLLLRILIKKGLIMEEPEIVVFALKFFKDFPSKERKGREGGEGKLEAVGAEPGRGCQDHPMTNLIMTANQIGTAKSNMSMNASIRAGLFMNPMKYPSGFRFVEGFAASESCEMARFLILV